jgi:hypothetical protein
VGDTVGNTRKYKRGIEAGVELGQTNCIEHLSSGGGGGDGVKAILTMLAVEEAKPS